MTIKFLDRDGFHSIAKETFCNLTDIQGEE